ncbi:MAG TPA: hypothetical protein VKZ53_09575 [Candidatus Angelobacter sp.]|nr:hypothetical protein [Candidatus Angelobacter sp.]
MTGCGTGPVGSPSDAGAVAGAGEVKDSSTAGDQSASSAAAPVDGSPAPCPCSVTATLDSLSFDTSVVVCRSKTTIAAPHWKNGEDVSDGAGSKKATVYLIAGKGVDQCTAQVNITSVVNCGGTAKLTGTIGDLTIEGQCPVAPGTHTVNCQIKKKPDAIKQYQGDISWKLEVPTCQTYSLSSTRVELYFVLDTPIAPYQSDKGVWVEVLRFLCSKVGVPGKSDKKEVVSAVTSYCHSSHSLHYDTLQGAPHYGVSNDGGTFDLERYLAVGSTRCNCYDQAAAVQSFSGAVGVGLTWLYLRPFGYLKLTNLIGVGNCNNPFYESNGSAAVVAANDPDRTAFGNHSFCEYTTLAADACAGPHLATEALQQYIDASIEKTTDTTLYARGFRPGTTADLSPKSGVTSVQ